ncbi:hypothetical protein QY97_03471 [Bacillus thermotolerans]|uniref:Uncharacterized protein n=1 Tax=Bacillus thermotolerans TaxID=1221996 RepID=A0A0F5I6F8_BACTR|nr:hypothetical protein QY97_03471 [Bacillus thermotolerans]KKB40757.1 hypothetical protein QY95_01331 [Bacillus thermotolerans]KKB41655.1 hypothetical protein QY96_01892 [Bacillus thermotolerans]
MAVYLHILKKEEKKGCETAMKKSSPQSSRPRKKSCGCSPKKKPKK